MIQALVMLNAYNKYALYFLQFDDERHSVKRKMLLPLLATEDMSRGTVLCTLTVL